jgi:hypothetical protein
MGAVVVLHQRFNGWDCLVPPLALTTTTATNLRQRICSSRLCMSILSYHSKPYQGPEQGDEGLHSSEKRMEDAVSAELKRTRKSMRVVNRPTLPGIDVESRCSSCGQRVPYFSPASLKHPPKASLRLRDTLEMELQELSLDLAQPLKV